MPFGVSRMFGSKAGAPPIEKLIYAGGGAAFVQKFPSPKAFSPTIST
jgi:hypothetical protein